MHRNCVAAASYPGLACSPGRGRAFLPFAEVPCTYHTRRTGLSHAQHKTPQITRGMVAQIWSIASRGNQDRRAEGDDEMIVIKGQRLAVTTFLARVRNLSASRSSKAPSHRCAQPAHAHQTEITRRRGYRHRHPPSHLHKCHGAAMSDGEEAAISVAMGSPVGMGRMGRLRRQQIGQGL